MADSKEGDKKKCCGAPKLYYTSTSCGFASFLSALKAGVKMETEQVDLKTHKTDSGTDFYTINPKGNVPALVFPCGTVLNENTAILGWIADQNLNAKLAPANGSFCRYKLNNVLAWLNSELHPGIGGLFAPGHDEVLKVKKANALKKLTYFEEQLLNKGKNKFVFGEHFTIADAYAAVVLSWTAYVGIDLKDYPHTAAYLKDQFASEVFTHAKKAAEGKPKHINH